jgi:acetyl-CoA carboxylase biotin carboxyl carrier protein
MKNVCAHISGVVWRIDVAVGAQVGDADPVVTLESMKMEMPVEAGASGKIAEIKVKQGQFVNEGDVIATIE